MADVFISYDSRRRHACEHLAEIMELHGWTVWYDRRLAAGSDLAVAIDRNLRSAKAVVVLWCDLSVASQWVRSEARLAKELGTYVPIKVTACELSVEFRGDHWIGLESWNGSPIDLALDPLFRDIGRLAGPTRADQDLLRRYDSIWRRFGGPNVAELKLVAKRTADSFDTAEVKATSSSSSDVPAMPPAQIPPPPASFRGPGLKLWEDAHRGDAEAQHELGFRYENGTQTKQDFEKAVLWYSRSASQGNMEALESLAYMYENGLGSIKNKDKAIDLYREAASRGNRRAASRLKKIQAQR